MDSEFSIINRQIGETLDQLTQYRDKPTFDLTWFAYALAFVCVAKFSREELEALAALSLTKIYYSK